MRTSFFLTILSLTVLASNPLAAQEGSSSAARTFLGASECVKCHLNGMPKGADPALAAAGFGDLADDSWVLLDELKTWVAADRHLQAFTALKNDRSKRMGKLLGVEEGQTG